MALHECSLFFSDKLFCCLQVGIEILYILKQAVFYSVITYAMIGFEWTASKFLWYLFLMYFTLLYFTFYGMMVVSVTPNHNISAVVAAAFYAGWNLFSGFLIPRPVSCANIIISFHSSHACKAKQSKKSYSLFFFFLSF